VAVRVVGLLVRKLSGAWSLVSVVCCLVDASTPLVQRSPSDCGVSECDREASIIRRT